MAKTRIAPNTATLEIFAEALASRGHHTNFVVGKQTKGDERAVKAIFGTGQDGFKRITHGKSVESYFRPGGKNAPEGPASVFLTYKMAEGINLQSADTLVLLGITSNLKELIQGLGRSRPEGRPRLQIPKARALRAPERIMPGTQSLTLHAL